MYLPSALLFVLPLAATLSLPLEPRRRPDDDMGGGPTSQTCTIAGDNVRYRTCPCAQSSCPALGQLNFGHEVTIVGQMQGTNVDRVHWWGKTSKGNWISGKYLNCNNAIPIVGDVYQCPS